MAQFEAMDTNVEVCGIVAAAFMAGVSPAFKEKIRRIMEKHGMDPNPDKWYPQQKWLSALKEVADTIGPNTLFSIGKSIPENTHFPPEIDTL